MNPPNSTSIRHQVQETDRLGHHDGPLSQVLVFYDRDFRTAHQFQARVQLNLALVRYLRPTLSYQPYGR